MAGRKPLPGSIKPIPAGKRKAKRWRFKARNGTNPDTGKPAWDQRTFLDLDEAIEYDAAHTRKTVRGALTGRSARFTVAEAIAEWIEIHALDEGTAATYEHLFQPIIDGHARDAVRALNKVQLARLAHQLHSGTCPYKTPVRNRVRTPWSATSVNKMLKLMEKVLEGLKNEGFLDTNHAALVPRLSKKRTIPTARTKKEATRESFDTSEVSAIFAGALAQGLNMFVICLLAFLGLRKGEIAGLQWDRVDLVKGRLWVVEQRKRDRRNKSKRPEGSEGSYDDTVKSEASDRDLPLPPIAITALKLVQRWQKERHLASGRIWGVDGNPPTHVVCNEQNGRKISAGYPWTRWYRLFKTLPVAYLHLHRGRTTCGTLLALQPGVGPHHVGAWLGHAPQGSIASPVTGVYIDADEEFRQLCADAWEAVFGPIVASCDMFGAYERAKVQLSA